MMKTENQAKTSEQKSAATSKSAHSIIAVIFSVLFAFIFWFYIQGEEAPDYTATFSEVEVNYRGLPKGLSLISRSNTTCDILLKGKRRDLSKIKSSNIETYIDLAGITSSGVYDIDLVVISPEGAAISSVFPEKVQVMVDVTISKSVPVNVEKGEYTTKPDTVLEVTPHDTVINVKGPKSTVDNISGARVFTGDLGEVNASFDRNLSYSLIDVQGNPVQSPYITTDQNTVTVNFSVTKTKTVATRLDFEYNYWGNDVKYTLSPSTVTIKGEPNFVDTIDSIAVMKIDETMVNTNRLFQKISPESFLLPEGISLSGKVGEVQADIVISNNISKTVKVPLNPNSTHFHVTGLENGMTASFKPESINLIVRGNAKDTASATISDFHLYVDLAGMTETGTENVEVKVVQTDSTKGKFYAVGTYTVKVTLTK